MDRAWLQVSSGAFDYKTAIARAVDDLAAGGIKAVTYPTGHRDTLEAAVRRCVLTGVNQTAAKLQLARMDEMGCEFVEVTAHAGARPEHAVWQGKVYHRGGAVTYNGIRYEDFETATGYGTGPGLCGWNCRHNFYPFYPGASERNYTDQRLAELADPQTYEESRRRRALERRVRDAKRRYLAAEAAGADTGRAAARLRDANRALASFRQETGGRADAARTAVQGFGRKQAAGAARAAKAENFFTQRRENVILDASKQIGVNPDVNFVCNLDPKLYRVVSDNILTDEVIITEQQISHVEDGHPGDFAKLSPFLPRAIREPDYILRANKPNTAVIIKKIEVEGAFLDVVLRLKVSGDPKEFKNSIITMWTISEKRFRRLLRHSEVLYKPE